MGQITSNSRHREIAPPEEDCSDCWQLLELIEHDVNRIFDQHEDWQRRLLALIEAGQIARARAMIRWALSRVAP